MFSACKRTVQNWMRDCSCLYTDMVKSIQHITKHCSFKSLVKYTDDQYTTHWLFISLTVYLKHCPRSTLQLWILTAESFSFQNSSMCKTYWLTICQTCMMLSSDTEQITHGSFGFQEKSEIFAVCPPWMNWQKKKSITIQLIYTHTTQTHTQICASLNY